jgi:DNA-binding PadR family transcriptional regulator
MSGLGRFADPSVLILTSLASGPKHGYALIKDIEQLTGAAIGPGTLYAALSRLERREYIETMPEEDRRRPYRITPAGVAALRSYLEQARTISTVGLQRLRAFA